MVVYITKMPVFPSDQCPIGAVVWLTDSVTHPRRLGIAVAAPAELFHVATKALLLDPGAAGEVPVVRLTVKLQLL